MCPNLGDVKYFKKTILHSRLPLNIFYNFTVNTIKNDDGSINYDRYKNLKQKYYKKKNNLNSQFWDLFENNSKNQTSCNSSNKQIPVITNEIDRDNDGDIKMTETDELFEPFLQEDIQYVTLMVYFDSFSINNGPNIELPGAVKSAAVLNATEDSKEDTLIIFTDSQLYLLRLISIGNDILIPFVVDFVSASSPLTFESRVHFNSKKTIMIRTIFNGSYSFYTIEYDKNGLPTMKLNHNSKIESQIIEQCIIPYSDLEDAIITASLDEGILRLIGIYNLELPKKHINIMKNTFRIPLLMVPMVNTNAILFLQDECFNIKSLSFCLSGDDTQSYEFKYPETRTPFFVNSYYIPQKKVITRSSIDEFTEDSYSHDQILVSTSNNNSVYALDIYYDKKRHLFSTNMERLFKNKQVVSQFVFEPINDSTFRFIYANEMGKCECKTVSIVIKHDVPILKTIKEFWSDINPYPILAMEVIDSPDTKKSIEYPAQELWVTAGMDVNHSIMSFKFGIVANKLDQTQTQTQIQKLYDIENLYCFGPDKVWASSSLRSILFNKDEKSNTFNPIIDSLIDEKILLSTILNEETQLVITTGHIFHYNTKILNITLQLKLPYKCILSTSYDNICAILYKKENLDLVIFSINKDQSFTHISFSKETLKTNLISMIKLVNINNSMYLFVGDFNGCISLLMQNRDNRTFELVYRKQIDLIIKPELGVHNIYKKFSSPEYLFIPYQIHLLDDETCIITSLNGEYIILEFHITNKEKTEFICKKFIKLSDSGSIDIIPTENPMKLYLLSRMLWKLDLRQSLFAEKVIFKDLNRYVNNDITTCTFLSENKIVQEDELLIIRNSEMDIWRVPNNSSVDITMTKLEQKCMKMKYYQALGIFVLIPILDSFESESPKLLFYGCKYHKILNTTKNINTVFDNFEYPLCLYVWKFYSSQGVYFNLLVGCKTTDGKGSIKILKLSKIGRNDIEASLVSSYKEDGPVTDIKFDNNHKFLIYSSGKNICCRYYSPVKSKFLEEIHVYNDDTRIKKIEYEFSDENKKLTVLTLNSNMIFTKITGSLIPPDSNIDENDNEKNIFDIKSVRSDQDQYCSDMIHLSSGKMIQSNYRDQTFWLRDCFNNSLCGTNMKSDYIPRLSLLNSFSPWVSLQNRISNLNEQFITVGFNGQIDSFKLTQNINLMSKKNKSTESDSDIGLLSNLVKIGLHDFNDLKDLAELADLSPNFNKSCLNSYDKDNDELVNLVNL